MESNVDVDLVRKHLKCEQLYKIERMNGFEIFLRFNGK